MMLTYKYQWKFAVISDTQGSNRERDRRSFINDIAVRVIAEDIVQEGPDFVIVTGDLVNGWFRNGGTDYATQYASWKKAMASVYDAGIRVYPIRGNHDSGPERIALPPLPSHLEPPLGTPILLKRAFRTAFPEPYIPKNGPNNEEGLTYSFSHKNAFIICLDQYSGGQHKLNRAWLERQLSMNRNPHIFIFGHEPAFEASHKDNLAFYPKERDIFWDVIGRAGARIYFCGHDHFYSRTMIPDNHGNKIWQIIAGTGGAPLKGPSKMHREDKRATWGYHNGDCHGYIMVTIEGPKVTVKWRAFFKDNCSIVWRMLDSFSYNFLEGPDSGLRYEQALEDIFQEGIYACPRTYMGKEND